MCVIIQFKLTLILYELTVVKPSQVSTWSSQGSVPVAVRSTSQFVEWLLNYQSFLANSSSTSSSPPMSSQSLRLLGGMLLLRFVNAHVDPLQKRQYALSVAGLAKQLGLPGLSSEEIVPSQQVSS
jgi:hypothetical protein